ncbi:MULTISPECIES: AbgT family transporter [unclassified Halanaerobium]|uniref:AbgT family transporter n=1 Tax=unclassified Halanaerobium TaxID=2641197 RepID=UPI000E158648|nr:MULTISPECIES: AbgT family transporter [unclassified Halanaerobium]RCW49914.1 aminobenzoyl-glutamate transport protein [Halanaerobium sp. MA284_MarDTE_T2]RCW88557.1 aminobenzoyl-glutamate transport protein [Halanaerobium sp. DL-01]
MIDEREMSNEKESMFYRFLSFVERIGNKLPHPFTLFVILTVLMVLVSFVTGIAGIQVTHPTDGSNVSARNLLSGEGIEYMILNLISNFTGFRPLGLVLGMMLGIGLAEKAGLMSAFMKKFMLGAPEKLLLGAIFLIGICGNIASDAAVIIVPPLAGAIFYGTKRNPLVGIAAGYAAASAGFTANLLIAGTDALLAGITEEAAQSMQAGITISPAVNYYFMVVSTFVLTVVGAWVTQKFVEPQAGEYVAEQEIEDDGDLSVSDQQSKGLKNAGIVTVLYWALVVAAIIPQGSPLRGPGGSLIPSTFLSGIVPFILFWFIAIGIAYGKTVGTIKSEADVPRLMGEAIKDMAGYIVLVFIIAQFVSYFNWTNLGMILAVKMADLLEIFNFTGFPMVVGVIAVSMFINLFIGSGSAKWALLSPVFVPMFMMLDHSPAFAQLAYRIGDSTTNAITPLFPYFPIVLGFMKRYDEDSGIGTVISYIMPYTIAFGVVWIILLAIWYFADLPIGPGAGIFL